MNALYAFRYGDKRLFARLVTLLRGGDSAHCEASIRQVADVHECVSSSWLDGGVRKKYMPLPPEKWRIYEVPVPAEDVLAWHAANEGCPYDWPGILGIVIKWIKHVRRWWFCSEVLADIPKLDEPHTYDLVKLEAWCAQVGRRVQ